MRVQGCQPRMTPLRGIAQGEGTGMQENLEAGTGIEPVYSDLQSNPFSNEYSHIGSKLYQDKPRTRGEPDTSDNGAPPANENPGALAGATGAERKVIFKSEHYRNRFDAATKLGQAIADCHPQDACTLMEAALEDLRAGWPKAPLFRVMDEAAFWADLASRNELKAYALACLSTKDRAGFLSYVQGGAA
jgi:hypothetical protein